MLKILEKDVLQPGRNGLSSRAGHLQLFSCIAEEKILFYHFLPLTKWTYQHYILDFSSLISVLSPRSNWTYRRDLIGLISAILKKDFFGLISETLK